MTQQQIAQLICAIGGPLLIVGGITRTDEAAATVTPWASSMTWAEMFLSERWTDRRRRPLATAFRRRRLRSARRLACC